MMVDRPGNRKYPSFSSRNAEETQDYLRRVVGGSVALRPLDGQPFDARIRLLGGPELTVFDASYEHGVAVVDPDPPENLSLLMLEAGAAVLTSGRREVVVGPGQIWIGSTVAIGAGRLGRGTVNRFLTVPAAIIAAMLERLAERPVAAPEPSAFAVLDAAGSGRGLAALVAAIEGALAPDGGLPDASFARRLFGDAVMMAMVESLPDLRARLSRTADPAPWQIRRARDFIAAQAGPVTVHEVAEAVGVGLRALQLGFRRHAGMTPQDYLKRQRLLAVRRELSNALITRSIGEIARHWGFLNRGAFAADYHAEFGEKPSETLLRR